MRLRVRIRRMDPEILRATDGGVMAARTSPWKARALNAYVQRGKLERVLPGVYSQPGGGATVDGKLQALRAYGDDLVVTRHHAAALTWWPELECPEGWLISCPRLITPGHGFTVEQRLIRPELLTRHRGVLMTSPELTALDLMPELGPEAGYTVLRNRATTVAGLQRAMALTPKRRGNAVRREILESLIDAPWSHLEQEAHRRMRDAGMRGWVSNHRVSLPSGNNYLDAAFEKEKLGLEFDGYAFHSSKEAFVGDRAKDLDLAQIGWQIVRFTAETVVNVVPIVRSLLAVRRRQLGLARGGGAA